MNKKWYDRYIESYKRTRMKGTINQPSLRLSFPSDALYKKYLKEKK